MTDAIGMLTIISVDDERAPIVSVQSVIASEPEKASLILKDTRNGLYWNPLAGNKRFEFDAI
jgi:hypothetical protein